MATTVDSILVRIDADLGDLRKELNRLDKTLSNTAQKTESRLKTMGNAFRTVLGAAIVYQTAQAGLALTNFVSGIEEMQAKSDVVFGQFVGTVRDQLGQFADEVGRSRFELEAMAASVQDTFVPLGFARGAAAELSVQLTKLATDVASFNNASDTETMAAFQSAIVGNHETVRRFGIVITEATLQQELHRMGIMKTSQEATNAEKVQARLNLIMAGTTDAQGDAARTADSFANRSKALGAALQDLAVTAVGPFLDDLADIVKFLTDAVKGMNSFLASFQDITSVKGFNDAIQDTQTRITELQTLLKEGTGNAATDFFLDKDKIALDIEVLKLQLENLTKARAAFIAESQKPAPADPAAEPEGQNFKDQEKAEKAIDRLIAKNRALAEETAGVAPAVTAFREEMAKLNAVTPEQEMRISDLITEYQFLQVEAEKAATKEKQLEEAMALLADTAGDDVAEKIAALNILMKEMPEYTDAAMMKIDELRESLVELDPLTQHIVDSMAGMSQSVGDAFADMLASGEFNLNALNDIAGDIVKQIISKMMQLMVINPIINAAMGAMGAPSTAMLPTMSGGSAGGGSMHPSRARIVGERGPELFVPHSAGTLLNNQNTNAALGGGGGVTVNQSLNFSVGVSDTVKAEIQNLMPIINQNAVTAVETARQRGGSIANAFGS